MNLGLTPVGREQGKYFPAQTGSIPSGTVEYLDKLQGMTEQVAMLTPGAKGESSATTGMGTAMEMLPTLYTIDWMRSHWAQGISGRSGINECIGVIWHVKRSMGVTIVPAMNSPLVLQIRQRVIMKPVIPRDRIAAIQEITALATAKALPPRELLKRLGDIENIDETLGELMQFLMWMAMWDAAVAGRPVKIGKEMQTDEEKPSMPLPEVAGPTTPSISSGTQQPANKAKEKPAK